MPNGFASGTEELALPSNTYKGYKHFFFFALGSCKQKDYHVTIFSYCFEILSVIFSFQFEEFFTVLLEYVW